MDFPSTPDLLRIARDEVLAKNSSLTKEIVDRAGSDANALMAASVAVADAVVGQLIRVTAATNIDNAKGKDLDRLLFDRFQLLRKDASPGLTTVELTLPTAALSSFLVPEGTQFLTSDGKLWTSSSQRTFPATAGPVSVPVRSALAGLSQQVRPGSITRVVSQLSAPAGLSVTNALASAGADDAESDEAFRARGKLFYRTARRGTLLAIESGALAVTGVRTARAFEVTDPSGSPARLVNLSVADAFTEQLVNALALPVSYATQSAALAERVRAGLSDVRAAGIGVVITVANVQLLGITLGLRFRASADVAATSAAARAVVTSFVNALAPGAPLIITELEEALGVVPGVILLGGEVLAPTLDVVPAVTTALRTSEGLITVTAEA